MTTLSTSPATATLKTVESILPSPPTHWVGDGFPVSSIFSPQNAPSPFLLFDYAGPAAFGPSDTPRGVDTHPHRGFETVTIVFQGELEHRDSAGNRGSIGPGDVQWMTAASGILHEEKHSRRFTRDGGTLEMAQLWVNLPARHKMDPPRYQELPSAAIPVIPLPDAAGTIRVIAGDFQSTPGAARTTTPVILWDLRLRKDATLRLPIPSGSTAAIFIRSGSITVNAKPAGPRQLAILSRTGDDAAIHAQADAELLIVGGQPIDEPIAAYGPFVMNTPDQIRQAVEDFRSGRFGVLE